MPKSVAGTAAETLGVSLVRGDILYRLQRKVGLIPPDGLGIVRRALFWSLFTWLHDRHPVCVMGGVAPRGGNQPHPHHLLELRKHKMVKRACARS